MTGYTARRCEQLRHFPRRSCKNCDLQFANAERQDRLKATYSIETSKEPVCPRVELILKIIIILLIIFLGFIKSKPC